VEQCSFFVLKMPLNINQPTNHQPTNKPWCYEQVSSRHLMTDEMHHKTQLSLHVSLLAAILSLRSASFWSLSTCRWLETNVTYSWGHFSFCHNELNIIYKVIWSLVTVFCLDTVFYLDLGPIPTYSIKLCLQQLNLANIFMFQPSSRQQHKIYYMHTTEPRVVTNTQYNVP